VKLGLGGPTASRCRASQSIRSGSIAALQRDRSQGLLRPRVGSRSPTSSSEFLSIALQFGHRLPWQHRRSILLRSRQCALHTDHGHRALGCSQCTDFAKLDSGLTVSACSGFDRPRNPLNPLRQPPLPWRNYLGQRLTSERKTSHL
jgi:hypothetical protein